MAVGSGRSKAIFKKKLAKFYLPVLSGTVTYPGIPEKRGTAPPGGSLFSYLRIFFMAPSAALRAARMLVVALVVALLAAPARPHVVSRRRRSRRADAGLAVEHAAGQQAEVLLESLMRAANASGGGGGGGGSGVEEEEEEEEDGGEEEVVDDEGETTEKEQKLDDEGKETEKKQKKGQKEEKKKEGGEVREGEEGQQEKTSATGGAGAPAATGIQVEAAGLQLATPAFGNGEKEPMAQGGAKQVLAREEVAVLKQGIAQDLERLARNPAVVAAPIQQQQQRQPQPQPQQQQQQQQPLPEVIVLPSTAPEPAQIEPEPAASQTIEEAVAGIVSQAQTQARAQGPLSDPPISQTVSSLLGNSGSLPAQIDVDPAPGLILNEAQRVGSIPPANSPLAPNIVVGPVSRPAADARGASTTIAVKPPTATMQPATTVAAPDSVITAPPALGDNGLTTADTSEPSDRAPVVKAVMANLRSTQKQLAVANQAQKLLSARTQALEMKLGQARDAVDEQERLAAKAKADAAVGLNVQVKSMISTDWKPWQGNNNEEEKKQ